MNKLNLLAPKYESFDIHHSPLKKQKLCSQEDGEFPKLSDKEGPNEPIVDINCIPNELITKILNHLVVISSPNNFQNYIKNCTELRNHCNFSKIQLIFKTLHSFACITKRMWNIVHDTHTVSTIFQSLARQFNTHPLNAPVVFYNKTYFAHIFISQYIKQNKYDRDLEIIKNIFLLASEALIKASAIGLILNFTTNDERIFVKNKQLQQGFLLKCDVTGPVSIITRFGEIDLYSSQKSWSGRAPTSLSEFFIKKLKATFQEITDIDWGYEITNTFNVLDEIRVLHDQDVKKTEKKELESKIGTSCVIFSGYSKCYTFYEIQQVNEIILDKTIPHDSKNTWLDEEVIEKIKSLASKKENFHHLT